MQVLYSFNLNFIQLQNIQCRQEYLQRESTLAVPLPVERMLVVQLVAMLPLVSASRNTSVILMLPVDQSVQQTQNAQLIRNVRISNVLTHALDFVELTHNAELSTMLQLVLAIPDMLGIHSGPANSVHQVSYNCSQFSCFHDKFLAFQPEPVVADPCEPNPCGQNSNPPRVIGDRCQCSCAPQMIGSPPNCRPECTINFDCPSDKACINRKCQDPCPGLCGVNAYCRVRNHIPICVCNRDFSGDPFSQCRRITSMEFCCKN